MEEVNKHLKVVEPSTEKKQQKLSYEELEQIASQLDQQSRQLMNELQKSNMQNIFKRLDYLFKVVENAPMFGDTFVQSCVDEIEGMLTIPKEESEESEKKESEE